MKSERWLVLVLVVLVLFKLWLVSAQTIFAIGRLGLDDELVGTSANHILSGEWLGPCSQYTLALDVYPSAPKRQMLGWAVLGGFALAAFRRRVNTRVGTIAGLDHPADLTFFVCRTPRKREE